MVKNEITNQEDIIDSRDIIDRIDQLQEDDERTEAESKELATLLAFASEAEGYCPDWQYGATIIRDSYFETYAEELADDIGAIDRNSSWPCCHIDWEAAADSLKMDYTEVDFGGVSYWVR